MSEQTQHPDQGGKKTDNRMSAWIQGYRDWETGLDSKQRIRYRALQVAACISAVIILIWGGARLLIREPELPPTPVIPTPPEVSGDISSGGDISSVIPGPDVSQPPEDSQLPGTEEVHITQTGQRDGVYTILVVGRDTINGSTDTMILVTYDTANNKATAMSLPRDTMVNVSWNTKKLNTVFNYYKGSDKSKQMEKGMAALQTHVGKLTGIIPNFYICVEWDAVGELVDAIDGVTFNVPYNMDYDDPEQNLHIHQLKGERLLDGDDAMEVIRWRKNNADSPYGHTEIGDSGRMKIQQAFLLAVAKQCLQLKNLWNIPEMAQVFLDNVKTNLSIGNLIWFGQKAINMNVETDLVFCTLPYKSYSRGVSYLLPDVEKLVELVNQGANPYQRDIKKSDLEVLVLNKDGSLSLTSGKLADASLAVPPVKEEPKEPEQQQQETPSTQQPGQGNSAPTAQQPSESQSSAEQNGNQAGQGTIIQPEQSADQPSASQGGELATEVGTAAENNGGAVSVLPARPSPVQ